MPELVGLVPAVAAWGGLAAPLPAAATDMVPVAAGGCIDALPGVLVIVTADVSAGVAASLHAIALPSSKAGDNARKRAESECVSWIIGLFCWAATAKRSV